MSTTASLDSRKDGSSNTAAAGTSTIQLDTMSLDQLNSLKQREEARLQALSQRYTALRQAAARIKAAKTAVQDLYNCDTAITETKSIDTNDADDKKDDSVNRTQPISTTKDVFVPLTESVYVPGKIRIRSSRSCSSSPQAHGDNNDDDDEPLLLVELGTGYFAEQSTTATNNYLQRKLNLVDANSDNGTFHKLCLFVIYTYNVVPIPYEYKLYLILSCFIKMFYNRLCCSDTSDTGNSTKYGIHCDRYAR